ncbi:hypothetical protein C5L30_002344 [Companilactobacillus farciminis]|uniref:HTH lysR-type domain-containing protein n=1 Tax=Companilactobacillus farciminis TaxID=1612 RepID=A0A4R5NES6_9LACO|nr:LysR family transcriptional regulator [Companilactobacillus farciminis]ATO45848.1 hypothetical protein LF20184_03330 [Companilactobacillus farciminis KCTC 3681 = DSM 20184]TDG71764.1 hypothetical protein C5L30_002344 [Companilactobacillus farciminis]
MELRALNYFYVVANESNITKAAETLHVTQPTLSRQIKQLEDELGTKLFARGQHGITLTNDGRLLRHRAADILGLVEKTELEISRNDQFISGEIRLGCGELKSMNQLATSMSEFRHLYPEVSFHMHTGAASEIKDRLHQGLLDVGLLMNPTDLGDYNSLELNEQEKIGVLIAEDSPLANLDEIHAKDLENVPLIMMNQLMVRNSVINWLGDFYSSSNVVATYNLLYNAALLARTGAGVAFGLSLDSHFEGVVFKPVAQEIKSKSFLVWEKQRQLSSTANAFIEHVRNTK